MKEVVFISWAEHLLDLLATILYPD